MWNSNQSGAATAANAIRALCNGSSLKFALLASASTVLIASLSAPAWAQTAGAPQPAAASAPETVVVTGTQVARSGFQSPTPLTVLNSDQIQAVAPTNISDYLDKMPAFANSESPTTSSTSVSDGNGGVSNLNLRSLGANRTLVLLDGMRVAPASVTGFAHQGGAVDINSFPAELVSKVDVVTGGASAAYGSDALAGVVNFILDKNYTGVKGQLQGGVTEYGDDLQFLGNLTAGTGFANDHGHFLVSGEVSQVNGIMHGNSRPWLRQGWDQIPNPNYTSANGQPFYVVSNHIGSGLFTPGGLIQSGPLGGIDFGPGGSTSMFNYGTLNAGGSNMIGGNWQETVGALTDGSEQYEASLDDKVSRQNLFARASYDITDDLEVFTDFAYSNTQTFGYCCSSSETATINSGNPFIPAPVQAEMTALGVPSFKLGIWNAAQQAAGALNQRQFWFYAGGASGDFDTLGTNWSWNVYGSHSLSATYVQAVNNPIKATFTNAVNVVTNPANGQPICASTLTNPTNGCVPYNPMGVDMNSPGAMAYATGGVGDLHQVLTQDDFAGALRGDPFSIWAGPVSVATGLEYRKLGVTGQSSTLDQANAFFLGDFHPTIGSYGVTEGFVETVLPLAKDYDWAKEMDLDLAVRETNYSTSGAVTTWKAGLTYDTPLEGLRLRATRSRDIRAPNLGELFAQGQSGQGSLIDSVHGNVTVPNTLDITVGNSALKPEVADTTAAGVVYQPSWFSGFSASLDFFDINIRNAIGSISTQNEVNQCAAGNQIYCGFIQRDSSGTISIVTVKAANTSFEKTSGFDLEASYQKPLSDFVEAWNGAFSVRLLATNTWELTTTDPTGLVTPLAGANNGGIPHWRYYLTAGYDAESYSLLWTGRGLSAGVLNRLYTQCTSGCPAFTAPYYTTNYNEAPGNFYMDLSLTYHVKSADLGSPDLFLTVEDFTNAHPNAANSVYGLGNGEYDLIGRVYRAGIRFSM